MSVDPLSPKYAMLTPYQFASNTPIWAIDLDGLEAATTNSGVKVLVIIFQGYMGADPEPGKTQAKNDRFSYVDYSGIAYVANEVKDHPEIQVVVFSSTSTSDRSSQDAATTIKNFKTLNPDGKVVVAGHSRGGDNAVEMVNDNPEISVDKMIIL